MPAFLETDRLVLRGFTEADADQLYELNSDHDVMWFLSGGEPTPREEVGDRIIPFFLSFYERYEGLGFWAAETRAAGDFLGWFHLRPTEDDSVDLGYRLRKAAWNQGPRASSRSRAGSASGTTAGSTSRQASRRSEKATIRSWCSIAPERCARLAWSPTPS